jgi:colanic acid biosynthesis glycosyl transferase WcaI
VSSISEGMREKILAKGVDRSKYFMLCNWVDVDVIKPLPAGSDNAYRSEFGFDPEDRIILYSGNLGEKQGIEVIVEVAGLLRDRKNWKFLICGEGVVKQQLIEATREQGLQNVVFAPLQPYNRLAELLNMAELHLVPQKRAAADLVLPSKLTGILAAGGVSIVASEEGTSLYRLMEDNKMGYTVSPENAHQLSEVIRKVLNTDNDSIRKSAREFAELHMSKDAILRRFEMYVEDRVGVV